MNVIKKIAMVGAVLMLSACNEPSESIATVNKRHITQTQFDAYLKVKRIPQQNEEQVAQALSEYLSREALSEAISSQKLLDASLLQAEANEYKKQLLISRYFEKFLQEKSSEQALRNYYAMHTEEFSKKKVHVAHILVRKNSGTTEIEKQALLTRLHEARTKINQGEAFAKIAEIYSDDKLSAKKGGNLGWIAQGAVDAEFARVAYALKAGELSEPVETNFGYHLIKSLDEPKVVQTAYEKVKGDIRYRLRQEARKAEMDRLTKSVTLTQKKNNS